MSLADAAEPLQHFIKSGQVVIFAWETCPFCKKAKEILEPITDPKDYKVYYVDKQPDGEDLRAEIKRVWNHETVPAVFIGGKLIGGASEVEELQKLGQLEKIVKPENP